MLHSLSFLRPPKALAIVSKLDLRQNTFNQKPDICFPGVPVQRGNEKLSFTVFFLYSLWDRMCIRSCLDVDVCLGRYAGGALWRNRGLLLEPLLAQKWRAPKCTRTYRNIILRDMQ